MVRSDGNAVDRAVAFLIRILSWVAAFFLAFMTVVYAVNVVGRYFFNAPLLGADEIVDVCLAALAFLAFGYTALHREHVSVDLVTSHLPGTARRVLSCFASLLGAVFWILVGWQAGKRTWEYLVHNADTTDVLGIPLTPFVFFMTVGCMIVAVQLLLDFYHTAAGTARTGGE